MSQHFLFVYGTLKRGFERHSVLQNESWHCEAVTVERHRLFDCGGYPGLVACSDGSQIRGEVYRVSDACLAACDEVECVAEGMYTRKLIAVRPVNDGGNGQNVWAYLYLQPTDALPVCEGEWPPQTSAGCDAKESGN